MGYTARFVPYQALYAKEQLCCNAELSINETSSSLDEDGLYC